jgi:hypothetical protein
MTAELVAQVGPGLGYTRLARGWLQGVASAVFPQQLDRLLTCPATHRVTVGNMHLPWGEPGQVRGALRFPARDVTYTPAAWQRMLGHVEKCTTASIEISVIGEDGFPEPRGTWGLAEVSTWRDDPGWARFLFSVPAAFSDWPESPELQDKLADFIYGQAAGMEAVVGVVSDLGGVQILEQSIFPPIAVHPHQWREVLYGYSWITIVPPS